MSLHHLLLLFIKVFEVNQLQNHYFTIWKDVQYKTAILNDGMHVLKSNNN